MDENPGISLFQNSHFEGLKSNQPALEEIEAQRDQIRYQKELEQVLESEFDDLDNMSNSSLNSSYSASISECNSRSFDKESTKERRNNDKIQINNVSVNENHQYRSKADYSNFEQLEVLYNVRLREIEKLREKINHLQEKHNVETSELSKALKQTQEEIEKTITSRNEIQKMLVETTSRLTQAEKELSNIRQQCLESEQIKSRALHELEMCKSTSLELENRLIIAEKNTYKSEEKQFDNLLKELTSKHKRELSANQKEIHSLKNKLTTKEIDYAKLEQQLIDLQRIHESMLNEKAKIIDKLNANLAESHAQFQALVACNNGQDTSKISEKLQQKTTENEALRREITALKENLVQYEYMKRKSLAKRDSSEFAKSKKGHSSNSNSSEIAKLNEDLHEASKNLNAKRTEIKELQEKLSTYSKEINTFKNTEAKYTEEIELLKKENEHLLTEMKKYQQEQEMLKIGVIDYVTKTDILHHEQLSELTLASTKKVLDLESKLRESEIRIKNDAAKIFTEEVDRITAIYSNHFHKLNETIECLKIESDEKATQIRHLNTNVEKLRSEIDKIYGKYKNARKIAFNLKQITEDRTQLLKRHHKQYVQTLNEIQKYLDNALISKTVETDKLTELIEKSTKNTIHVDELLVNDEINVVLCDMEKRLSSLEKV